MDNLAVPFHQFYSGQKLYAKNKMRETFDATGKQLLLNVCKREQIKQALTGSGYNRRAYSVAYLNRSEDGANLYLSDFEQLGARWVKEFHEISSPRDGHTGWYTDTDCDQLLIGVVLCFTRHGSGEDEEYFGEGRGKNKNIYMAGTKHSDWDGVTLGARTTDCIVTAARWADDMAEREADKCREEDEEHQRQNRIDGLRDDIKMARAACLKLLRDMRPLRKGMSDFPESVCSALREQVKDYCTDIAEWRNELGGLV